MTRRVRLELESLEDRITPSVTANNDMYLLMYGTPFAITDAGLLGNDTGSSLSASLVSQASHGTATVNSDGTFEYEQTDLTFAGNDTFTYQATDGTDSDTATVTLNIPWPTTSLDLAVSPSAMFYYEGEEIEFTATVTVTPALFVEDAPTPTGNVVFTDTLTSTTLATVSLNANGVASFSTASLTAGSYSITAAYAGAMPYTGSSDNVWLTIYENTTPILDPIDDQFSAEGDEIDLDLSTLAYDPDSQTLTYSATGLPTGLSINASTGVIVGTIGYDAAQVNGGRYSVSVTVTDTSAAYDTQTFDWVVADRATLGNMDDRLSYRGDVIAFQVPYFAAPDVTPSFSASGLPDGLSIDSETGLITGSPTTLDDYEVTITLDAGNGTDERSFAWHVIGSPVLAPTIIEISDDSGAFIDDALTNDTTLIISGTAEADSAVTLYLNGILIGTTAADEYGDWEFDYTATALAETSHSITATATVDDVVSLPSSPYLATVDLTGPTVVIDLRDPDIPSLSPVVIVAASDLNGVADGTTVYVDVDLDEDEDFEGGEVGYASGTMTDGFATIRLPALPGPGTYVLRARTTDAAGNEGTSEPLELTIDPVTLTLEDATIANDSTSSARVYVPLDLNTGPCECGAQDLAFNSASVNDAPVMQVQLQLSNEDDVPEDIRVELFWDDVSQGYVDVDTSTYAPGDRITVALPVVDAIVGLDHLYRFEVTFPGSELDPLEVENRTFSLVDETSAISPGWGFTGAEQLHEIASEGSFPAGLLRVYQDGTSDFYAEDGLGGYTNPSGDNGTLAGDNTSGWTYTLPKGDVRYFNASGYFTGWESADGERSTALTYSGGLLDTYTAVDGTVTTFNYTYGVLTSIDIGERTVTLAYTDGDLTSITDVDGSVRDFEYDANHRLIGETIAGTDYARGWEYTNGLLTGETFGTGDELVTWQIQSASQVGLDEPVLGNAWSHITDPNGQVTSRLFNADGNLIRQIDPEGGIERFTYEDGWLVGYTDALGRTTSYARDALGFVTEITYPDETTETFVYQNDFHALTDSTDERGTVTHYEYDEDGHVIAITDAYGTADAVTTNYVWEGGLLVEVRDDGDNLLFEYEYDAYNRKISDTDGEANEQTWTYDVNGNVATWIDGRGITTSYTNDAKGRVLSVTIDSVTQKFEYDDAGNLTRMIDADGTYFDTEYDSRGNAVRSIAGSNTSTPIITRNVFDDADQLIGVYDSNGNYTSFAYDSVGRLTSTTDALGNSDRIAYNAAGEMIGYRDVLGNWTRYTLDVMGQVEVITDALGNETTFTYDDGGLVTVVEDALNNETLYTYNARGQIETSEDADGVSFVYAYDDNGLLLSVTDELGRVTTYGRDAMGNVTSVTEADGTASERAFTFTLDENGNVIESADALSRDTTYEYDDFDRLIETTDAAGNVWEWTYADNGNVLTETYNGKTTAYAYDALGRLVLTTDADGRETHFEYGNDSRLMRVIDGEENATEYLYDALGRLVLTIAADGGTTEQRYDAASNLVALIDPVGNTTTWLYDRRYQVVSETDPLGEASFAIYDEVGRASSTTDRLGRTKVFTYSDAGRLLTEEWYDAEDTLIETLTYTYYEDGRLHTATNSAGTYTYTYDDLGRVATVVDLNGITLTYGWNEVDNLVTLSDSEGGLIESVYDDADRLIERAQSGTGVESLSIQIGYDEEGRRGELRRYSDSTGTSLISSTEYGYDDAGNLTDLVHKDDADDPIVTYVNTFDENSRITSESRNSVTVNYQYDETNQVIDDDTNEYEYDLNGNRTMDGYTTGAGNRIETDGTWTYSYDLEGNIIKKSKGEEAETWTYGYDHNNRLLWVEKAETDGGIVRLRVEFSYDVFGNRIKQQIETFDAIGDPIDTETNRYAFIGQQVWADLDEAGDIVTRYLLGDAMGERFARSGDGDTFWLLTDRLGSIREVLDETGELVDEITYDAFGNVTNETDPGLGGDYLFTGLRWFAAIGLYGTPNRDYDPTIGRWLQEDPISFNGGLMNLSGYVGNNGMNATDLSGLQLNGGQGGGAPAPGGYRPPGSGSGTAMPLGGGPGMGSYGSPFPTTFNPPKGPIYPKPEYRLLPTWSDDRPSIRAMTKEESEYSAYLQWYINIRPGERLRQHFEDFDDLQQLMATGPGPGGRGPQASRTGSRATSGRGRAPICPPEPLREWRGSRMTPSEAREMGLGERSPDWPWSRIPDYDAKDRHHPLMQGKVFEDFWKERGWEPDAVKKWTVDMNREFHRAISRIPRGGFAGPPTLAETNAQLEATRAFWDAQLFLMIRAREQAQGGKPLTKGEVEAEARRLLAMFDY